MAGNTEMVQAEQSLPGSSEPMAVTEEHQVFGRSLLPPWPAHMETTLFGMGCFWGAERLFWQQPGVYLTMVGYAGGFTVNPTYKQVCTGDTGHAEVVQVVFDPEVISYRQLLALFWENHDPTQGMRQGNDIGTQYRSVIYTTSPEQQMEAQATLVFVQQQLEAKGLGEITTVIEPMPTFYYAETGHQQYLARHLNGYCGLKGTGVTCPL